jgi:hypothetical protein
LAPFVYQANVPETEHICAPVKSSKNGTNKLRWKTVSAPGVKGERGDSPPKDNSGSTRSRSGTPTPRKAIENAALVCRPKVIVAQAMPMSSSEALALKLESTMRFTEGTGHDICSVVEYLHYLPSRTGHSESLDNAIECLLLSHQQMLCENAAAEDRRLRAYGRALTSLKTELGETKGAAPAEALCAATLLCNVELMSKDETSTQTAWLTHIGGSTAILKAWGSERFKADFEKAILFHHAGQTAASSLFNYEPCFLESSAWMRALENSTDSLEPWFKFYSGVLPIYVRLPGILFRLRTYRGATTTEEPGVLDELFHLADDLRNLQTGAESLLIDPNYVRKLPSADPTSPFQTCYVFSNLYTMLSLGIYWRLLIIVSHKLHHLSQSISVGALDPTIVSAAEHLGMSAEGCRRWAPFATMFQMVNLPLAVFAYSHYSGRCMMESAEAQWLVGVVHEFVDATPTTWRTLHSNYLDIFDMFCPDCTALCAAFEDTSSQGDW